MKSCAVGINKQYFYPAGLRPHPPGLSAARVVLLFSSLLFFLRTSLKCLFLRHSWTEFNETLQVHSLDHYEGINGALFSTFDPPTPYGPKNGPFSKKAYFSVICERNRLILRRYSLWISTEPLTESFFRLSTPGPLPAPKLPFFLKNLFLGHLWTKSFDTSFVHSKKQYGSTSGVIVVSSPSFSSIGCSKYPLGSPAGVDLLVLLFYNVQKMIWNALIRAEKYIF